MKLRLGLAVLLALLAGQAHARDFRHAPSPVRLASAASQAIVAAKSGSGVVCGGYTGPGDVDSNWTHWWGMRAYSASTCGTRLIQVVRASGTGTCYGVSGQSVCDIKSLSSNGQFDDSNESTFCSGTTCTVAIIYDQVGSVQADNNGTAGNNYSITANCINTTMTCLSATSSNKLQWPSNITVNNGSTVYEAAKLTATTGGNRIVGTGQALFNISIGWGTTDHADCIEGAAEIVGTVASGTWIRAICVANVASSKLIENGTTITGTLISNSASSTGYVGTSGGAGSVSWVEGGINSTTMGSTAATLDSNVSTYWGI